MSNTNIKKVRTSDLELKDRLVSIQRVTKVTKGGRTFSFSAIVVVGNENGVVGYGLGKASEVTSAIAKGVEDAKKNLVKIPVLKGTIPHKQEARYSGSLVMIRPAAPGTGVIAGGAMRAVLESVNGYSTSPETRRTEDYDLVMRLAANGVIGENLQEILYSVYEPQEAYLRHNARTRMYEVRVRARGLRAMGSPASDYIYLVKPLIMACVPRSMMRSVKRLQWKLQSRDTKK